MTEFQEDILRVKYIRRLLHRYTRTGDISVRLLLNHIIGIYNVFHPPAIARLLFFRTNPEAWSALKTILEYLNLMPDVIDPVDGCLILNTNIKRDDVLWDIIQNVVEGYAANR